jgi:hypothetical protein
MSGRFIGSIGFCVRRTIQPGADESVVADKYRAAAVKNIKHYAKRYPIVLAARVGRTWSLYRVADSVRFGTTDGRPKWVSTLGLVAFYPLALLAIAGVWIRRRRRELLWPLLVPPVIVTLASMIAFGSVRYRTSAEPVIVVLAAIALTSPELWRRRRSRREDTSGAPDAPVPVA